MYHFGFYEYLFMSASIASSILVLCDTAVSLYQISSISCIILNAYGFGFPIVFFIILQDGIDKTIA